MATVGDTKPALVAGAGGGRSLNVGPGSSADLAALLEKAKKSFITSTEVQEYAVAWIRQQLHSYVSLLPAQTKLDTTVTLELSLAAPLFLEHVFNATISL